MDARRIRMVSAWVLVLTGLAASAGLTSMTEGFNPSDGQNLGITTADRQSLMPVIPGAVTDYSKCSMQIVVNGKYNRDKDSL